MRKEVEGKSEDKKGGILKGDVSNSINEKKIKKI